MGDSNYGAALVSTTIYSNIVNVVGIHSTNRGSTKRTTARLYSAAMTSFNGQHDSSNNKHRSLAVELLFDSSMIEQILSQLKSVFKRTLMAEDGE